MDVHNHIYMKGLVSLQNSLTICKMLIPMFLSVWDFSQIS